MNPGPRTSFFRSLRSVKLTDSPNHIAPSSLPVAPKMNSSSVPIRVTQIPSTPVTEMSYTRDNSIGSTHSSAAVSTAHQASIVYTPSSESSVSAKKNNNVTREIIATRTFQALREGFSSDKENIQEGYQGHPQSISTQPSSLSRDMHCASDTNAVKCQILSLLVDFKKMTITLEKILEAEFSDLNSYNSVTQQCKLILHDVSHNLVTAGNLIDSRNEQLEAANKRIRLLMGEDLTECTNENLEDISDILWSGLQAATLALSRRQNKIESEPHLDKNRESASHSEKHLLYFEASNIPEAKFTPVPLPVLKCSDQTADQACNKLSDILEEIRSIQKSTHAHFLNLKSQLISFQQQIEDINNQYDQRRTQLLLLEKKLDTRSKQVNRLTGRDTYENLTDQQLIDLCKTINKATRRLTTEQAIREVRAQQKSKEDGEHDTVAKCFVCFERPVDCVLIPCQHSLCSDCAERLKFCPQCRKSIDEKRPTLQKSQSALSDIDLYD